MPGIYESTVSIPENFFAEGTIMIGAAVVTHNPFIVHFHENDVIAFNMIDKAIKILQEVIIQAVCRGYQTSFKLEINKKINF